jgi:hypothetical protein
VTVLNYESSSQVFLSPSVDTPVGCSTAPYLAGANETAILSLDVTALGTSTTFLYLAPMFSVNGGGAQFGVSIYAVGPLGANVYNSLHSQAVIQLAPGVTYQFMTGVRSAQSTSTNDFICRGMATIVRR